MYFRLFTNNFFFQFQIFKMTDTKLTDANHTKNIYSYIFNMYKKNLVEFHISKEYKKNNNNNISLL